MAVTDFPHVRRMFTDAYARLVAMKLFALRAADYFRSASREDRRYLLYNPVVKMKVTTEGEKVIDLLWDVIAAKGFEKDTYFEMAARDIRALPKLEGTVHVNIALIVKFMKNYFFAPGAVPGDPAPRRRGRRHVLLGPGAGEGPRQDPLPRPGAGLRGLGRSPTWRSSASRSAAFREMLVRATPTEEQAQGRRLPARRRRALHARRLRAARSSRTPPLYAQEGIDGDIVDQIFDVLVRDFSRQALDLHVKPGCTAAQMDLRPEDDPEAGLRRRPLRPRVADGVRAQGRLRDAAVARSAIA